MRTCVFETELLRNLNSQNLVFLTELNYIVIDCGDETVDLIIQQFIDDDKLSKIIERIENYSDKSYIDQEFFKFIECRSEFSTVNLDLDDVKAIFNPVIERIIRLVNAQLLLSNNYSALILVSEFRTDIMGKWIRGDPEERNYLVAELLHLTDYVLQCKMSFDIYITPEDDAKYIDDLLVKSLEKWSIELPLSLHDDDHSILFTLMFGSVEIQATAVNTGTGDIYETTFDLYI
ncbi:9814_t:CDS:2 [Funneliformis caledonium]|uniref:9814_t:CDS:1 n=1 Tax=Funneliformis caledonium TaxID=1117310 RepID=A0A9N9HWG6_9GLOM|nr:9814_t:CDS:2 [Funneliformis caledonium]